MGKPRDDRTGEFQQVHRYMSGVFFLIPANNILIHDKQLSAYSHDSGGAITPAGRSNGNPKIPAACELLYSNKEMSIFRCTLFEAFCSSDPIRFIAAGRSPGATCFRQSDATP